VLAGFLLTLREGLEAALLIGITLVVVTRLSPSTPRRGIWAGVAAATAVSIVVALVLQAFGAKLEGRAEQIFEGVTMLLAAAVLTWMILWMQGRGRGLRSALEADVAAALQTRGAWALFLIAFAAVLREGVETALFLTAASMAGSTAATYAGAAVGLTAAAVLGWVLYATTLRLDLRAFFTVTSILLILFAAGLVAHAAHEFNEAGVLPGVIEPVWDLNPVLPEDSPVGATLRILVGYNGNPSLTEVIAYLVYLVVLVWLSAGIYRPGPNQGRAVRD
jgi:high-affinity iron transporter